jgi:hypothetical protein
VIVLLGTMLEAAVADGLIAANPAHGAKRPRIDRQPVVPFTDAECEALRAAAPDWFAVALTLGLGAGLRQSEATGLTLDRVDFLRRELTIDRQLSRSRPARCGGGPPSRSGRTARCRWLTQWSRRWPATSSCTESATTVSSCMARLAGPWPRRVSGTSGGRRVAGRGCPRRGSTTAGTPSLRRCCRAGCRCRRPPSTWATPRPCCCPRTRICCRRTTTGPVGWSRRRSAKAGVSPVCQRARSARASRR